MKDLEKPQSMTEQSYQKIWGNYAKRTRSTLKGFDPAIIAVIVQLMVSLMDNCFNQDRDTSQMKEFIERQPVRGRLAVWAAVRKSPFVNTRRDVNEMVETVIDCCKDSTPQEMQQFYEENRDPVPE